MNTDNLRMGTVAHHPGTDIDLSVTEFAPFWVGDETETHYIGSWVEGFGFIEVEFPKETTRELTPEERERFERCEVVIE